MKEIIIKFHIFYACILILFIIIGFFIGFGKGFFMGAACVYFMILVGILMSYIDL
jgi:hypothetical protein